MSQEVYLGVNESARFDRLEALLERIAENLEKIVKEMEKPQ